MGYAITTAAVVVLAGLVRLTSPDLRSMANRRRSDAGDRVLRVPPPTASMGRDRVPAQWYMAPAGDPAPSRAGSAAGDHAIPEGTIRWWAIGAVVFAALDVLAWATGWPVAGVIVGAMAVFAVIVAVHGRRKNRWLREASTWNTGTATTCRRFSTATDPASLAEQHSFAQNLDPPGARLSRSLTG
jgi:hypothetical protein